MSDKESKGLEDILQHHIDSAIFLGHDDRKSLKRLIIQRIKEVMPEDKLYDQYERGWNAYREEMLKRIEQL